MSIVQLREQIGASVSKAFYNFGKMLDAWARRALSELELRFDAHADQYRAHLARLNGGKQASEAEEISIQRDLDQLQARPAGVLLILVYLGFLAGNYFVQ